MPPAPAESAAGTPRPAVAAWAAAPSGMPAANGPRRSVNGPGWRADRRGAERPGRLQGDGASVRYLPCQSGGRFSANARGPSMKSWLLDNVATDS